MLGWRTNINRDDMDGIELEVETGEDEEPMWTGDGGCYDGERRPESGRGEAMAAENKENDSLGAKFLVELLKDAELKLGRQEVERTRLTKAIEQVVEKNLQLKEKVKNLESEKKLNEALGRALALTLAERDLRLAHLELSQFKYE